MLPRRWEQFGTNANVSSKPDLEYLLDHTNPLRISKLLDSVRDPLPHLTSGASYTSSSCTSSSCSLLPPTLLESFSSPYPILYNTNVSAKDLLTTQALHPPRTLPRKFRPPHSKNSLPTSPFYLTRCRICYSFPSNYSKSQAATSTFINTHASRCFTDDVVVMRPF
jgi:hypothetical protein